MSLFLDCEFCSIDLYVYPYVYTILSSLLKFCNKFCNCVSLLTLFLLFKTVLVILDFKKFVNFWKKKKPSWSFYCCCSVTQSCPTLCNPMDYNMPSFPVLHYFPELAQTHVHWVSDVIQLSHPLSPSFPSAFNLSQHQGLFQWVGSSYQVAKVLELKLQHQSFQWYSALI